MATSNFKGVYYRNEEGRRKRWCARIMVDGKYHNIGNYLTEKEAADAYVQFIEENKNILTNRAKNLTKNRQDFERDENGLITRVCSICGKEKKFKKAPLHDHCKSCGKKEFYKNNPANGLKTFDNLDQIIQEYIGGASLSDLSKKYNTSAMTIRSKIFQAGYNTRDDAEKTILSNQKYGNLKKAHDKLKELCETGEFQKQRSAMLQGISVENWTGFVTPENKQFYKTPEYKQLQKDVFTRDDFTCKLCNKRGGKIQLHHIKKKCAFPELKLEKSNCCTLCKNCHDKTKGKEEQFESFFQSLLY